MQASTRPTPAAGTLGPPAGAPGGPPRVSGLARGALRIIITLNVVGLFLQAVFAGRFLSGDFGMLNAHQHNALFGVLPLALVQVVVAVLYWAAGGGRGWPALASLALLVADAVQMILGFARQIGVHIPLGVLIIALGALLLVWVWSPASARHRSAGRAS